ncbi:MAG: serine/threonine-protein kinase [Myxococcales bacterium]|nr:serine/threonine protein kinase [Myxococcota bacterium]MDW8283713.1 serine/threonine-protein kinase [Myxococcales bacterium]
MRAQDLVGQTVNDTYIVLRLLGSGTMGTVLEVRHVRLPRRFAMKVLHSELAEGPEGFARFRREAEIASSLGHPNIVDVVDWNRLPDGTPYLVMEYLVGEDLGQRMARTGPLALPAVLELARQVGSALSAAHKQGVVHRDLKPQNIFLCREDRGEEVVEVAKVVDFGISKILGADGNYTGAMRVMGTPLYMAPEQAMGLAAQVDGRADQFALAAILYHALSGRRPFDGNNVVEIAMKVMTADPVPLRQLVPELPEAVEGAILQALSKDRDRRFATIGDFVRALGAMPTGRTGSTWHLSGRMAPMAGVSSEHLRSDPSGVQVRPVPSGETGELVLPGGVEPLLIRRPLLDERGRSLLALAVIALVAGVISWAAVRAAAGPMRRPVPAVASPPPLQPVVRPPQVPRVRLQFVVHPPTAEVYLEGTRVETEVQVPRGEVGLRLEVRAPGYLTQTDMVVPSSDQRILIRLAPRRR